jgi:hypothetical protein
MSAYTDHILGHANGTHYWRFGGDTADVNGTANMTLLGSTSYGTTLIDDVLDQSLLLAGAGYGENNLVATLPFSVIVWFNVDANTDQVLFSFQPTNSIVTILIEGGLLKVRVNTSGTTCSTGAPSAGETHMVAVTIDTDGTTRLYLDGDYLEVHAATPYTAASYNLDIGRYGDFGGGYYVAGRLDEISTFNAVLDDGFIMDAWTIGTGVTPAVFTAGSLSEVTHTTSSVTLSWTSATDSNGAVTEQLQRSASGAGIWSDVSGAVASPSDSAGLAASTAYDFRVAYTDESPETVYSNTVTVTTSAVVVATNLALHLRFDEPNTGSAGQFAHGYLSLPGRSGYYASAGDSTALSIIGDIDMRQAVAMTDWTPSAVQSFLAKYNTGSNQRSYHFAVNTDGTLFSQVSSDGTGATTKAFVSSVAPSVSNGQLLAIRAAVDVDNGSGNAACTFYTKATTTATAKADCESDSGWTQLGSVQLSAGTTSIFDSTAVLEIGQGNPLAGNVYATVIKNGINGTTAFSADFTTLPMGTTSFLESSSNAAVVTVNGPIVADSTVNVRDGIAVNGLVFGSVGQIAKAGTFDGVNDYARVRDWTTTFTQFSVTAWIKPTANNVAQMIVTKTEATGGFELSLTSGGKLRFRTYNAGTGTNLDGATTIPTTSWTQVVCTYDGTTAKLYVNGVSDVSSAARTVTSNTIDFLVGAVNPTTPATFFGGLIDDVRIYEGALTQAEITPLASTGRINIIKPRSFF